MGTQSTQQAINQCVQQPSTQSRFSHRKNESTAASSKQCNYVRCSFLWIHSLPPFWLVYLSCFPSQVASRHVVFCTLWLRHVSRAATARTSSTSELRKVVQAWCIHFARQNVLRTTTPRTLSTCQHPNVLRACGVFIMLTWTYASCHNDVQCFISDIDTCGATNHWDK